MPPLLSPCRPVAPRGAPAAGAQAQAHAARLHAPQAAVALDVMLRGPLSSPFQRSVVLQVRATLRALHARARGRH